MKISRISQALFRSPSLRIAAVMGLGGVGFSLGSLLLARTLPTGEYGLVALVLGIIAVGGLTAPLGLDQIAARRGIRLDARWRCAVLVACAATALGSAVFAALVYRLPLSLAVSVGSITLAVGLSQAAGGHLQGRQRLGTAVWVVQLFNGSLTIAALAALMFGLRTASAVCALIALIALLAAAAVWRLLRRDAGAGERQPSAWALRREAMPLLAVQTGNAAFLQLERLLIGPIVGLHDLALYSVLAAFVSSPFRLLQSAVQFTLIPTLRVAGDGRARRAKLLREAALVLAIITAGSAAIWVLAPPLAHWLVAGRYRLPHEIIAATLICGFLKVLSGFLTAVVVSCGEARRLRLLSLVCWGSIAVGVAGAFAGGPWGIVGVVYGIAAGWLLRCVLAGWLALPHLRARERPPAPAPEATLRTSAR
jgi:O-antigen/teichoic acid export membrane protein